MHIRLRLVSQPVELHLQIVYGLLVLVDLDVQVRDIDLVVLDFDLQAVYLVHVDVGLAAFVFLPVYELSQLVDLRLVPAPLFLPGHPDLLLELGPETNFGLLEVLLEELDFVNVAAVLRFVPGGLLPPGVDFSVDLLILVLPLRDDLLIMGPDDNFLSAPRGVDQPLGHQNRVVLVGFDQLEQVFEVADTCVG